MNSLPETLAKAIEITAAKVNMPVVRSVILGILAGIFISVGGMLLALVNTAGPTIPFAAKALMGGSVFTIGLVLVLIAGAELFTGNVLALQSVLDKKVRLTFYIRNLIIVWLANLVGALIAIFIIYFAQIWQLNSTGAIEGSISWGQAVATIAAAKVNQSWSVIFFKGVLCNMLVCLAIWMSWAGKSLTDKFLAGLLPVTAFIALGTEHVVANMFLIPVGYVMKLEPGVATSNIAGIDNLDIGGILWNLGGATAGNIVGGGLLIALLYWLAFNLPRQKKTKS